MINKELKQKLFNLRLQLLATRNVLTESEVEMLQMEIKQIHHAISKELILKRELK